MGSRTQKNRNGSSVKKVDVRIQVVEHRTQARKDGKQIMTTKLEKFEGNFVGHATSLLDFYMMIQ
jgi:hypothetical protein